MLIEFDNLGKTFGTARAVRDFTARIDKPIMLGVIGPSGAGKSTLLRLVNRLTEPTHGAVRIDGDNVLALRGAAKRAWQRDCAMIFQQFNLVPRLDVVTNAMMGRLNGMGTLSSMFGLFSRSDLGEALTALDRLGIAQLATQRAEQLSGGQQQRVAIARALMQRPRMILADEPIASLDPMNAEIVMRALRDIHEQERLTVICNLHTLDTARTYCDRVIGMRAGEIVFDGAAHELTARAAREIYGAEDGAFNEAATSTSLDSLDQTPVAARA